MSSNPNVFSFSMNITSSVSSILLPKKITFPVKKIKIVSASYTTADNNLSYFMMIYVQKFDPQRLHINSAPGMPVNVLPYTVKLPLNAQSQSQNIYLNRNDSYDAVSERGEMLQTLDIECTINGVYSSLISPSNPVYLEILLSG